MRSGPAVRMNAAFASGICAATNAGIVEGFFTRPAHPATPASSTTLSIRAHRIVRQCTPNQYARASRARWNALSTMSS